MQIQPRDFNDVRRRDFDQLHLPNHHWLATWHWAEEYQTYNGAQDLIRWFEWFRPFPHYFDHGQVAPLALLSEKKNREILASIAPGREYTFQHVDEYSATDFMFQNAYPVPERMRVRRILDFGAGYGRQVNLWSQLQPGLIYVGMDAIELPYCLQSLYYSFFKLPVHDYVEDPDSFSISPSEGIYHLPTWRTDLLQDDFFDMVLCVQVLPEIDAKLVTHMLKEFMRCLKPGGALYVRDHEATWQPTHKLQVAELLLEMGFSLEFRPYAVDSYWSLYMGQDLSPDVHGIPRLWRKRDPRYPQEQSSYRQAKESRRWWRLASLDRARS